MICAQLHKPEVSVLTLVRGRQTHLDNLISGLAEQTHDDFELVIASMQPVPPTVRQDLSFKVTIVSIPMGEQLPLAKARNAAAASASGDSLVLLDVDCIPSPTLVASYARALDTEDRCFLGEVRYLPKISNLEPANFSELWDSSKTHPARPEVPEDGWLEEDNARQLWGLSFGIRRDRYLRAGGMDEGYTGYGGEETDFAERLSLCQTDFAWLSKARAVHQWHRVFTPPLDKFSSIVENAQRFYGTWGTWCMEHWLDHFNREKFIEWSIDSQEIEVLRRPSQAEIDRAMQPSDVCFA